VTRSSDAGLCRLSARLELSPITAPFHKPRNTETAKAPPTRHGIYLPPGEARGPRSESGGERDFLACFIPSGVGIERVERFVGPCR